MKLRTHITRCNGDSWGAEEPSLIITREAYTPHGWVVVGWALAAHVFVIPEACIEDPAKAAAMGRPRMELRYVNFYVLHTDNCAYQFAQECEDGIR